MKSNRSASGTARNSVSNASSGVFAFGFRLLVSKGNSRQYIYEPMEYYGCSSVITENTTFAVEMRVLHLNVNDRTSLRRHRTEGHGRQRDDVLLGRIALVEGRLQQQLHNVAKVPVSFFFMPDPDQQ